MMLSEPEAPHVRRMGDRRAQSHNLITELVTIRTEMLASYGQLAARRPFVDEESLHELLQDFCQILIDYTASAHFRLYRYVEERMEKRKGVLQTAEAIYPRVSAITECIVKFNDRYETPGSIQDVKQLEKDLSRLGEFLAERIELEDQLIEALLISRSSDKSARSAINA